MLIVRAGLQTTVQDLGRWGLQAKGVPVAGAMDGGAHRLANALAGNRAGEATLEVTLDGPEIEFEDQRLLAVAGADFDLELDGAPVPTHHTLSARAGSRLRFGPRRRGARAYLAISGGIAVGPVFGSRSTHVPSRMGGFHGRALASGDRVPLGVQENAAAPRPVSPQVVGRIVGPGDRPARLRVLPGLHLDRFVPGALEILQSGPYTLDAESNRMGFRLNGPRLEHTSSGDIVSSATPLGTVQVPGSGQPVLLMADRQTTGGYSRLATLITADTGAAAQLAPGDALRFEVCAPAAALAALVALEQALMTVERGV